MRRVELRRVGPELCERSLHAHVAQLSDALPARQRLLAERDAPEQHADASRAGRSGPRLDEHQAAAVAAATARLPELQRDFERGRSGERVRRLLAANQDAQLLPRARPLSRHCLQVCEFKFRTTQMTEMTHDTSSLWL